MSNAKIISLIAHAESRVKHEDEVARTALAADLYDTLRAMVIPLAERIERLEAETETLKATLAMRSDDGRNMQQDGS